MAPTVPPDPDDHADAPFRDAEAWLAARGVRREPIRLTPPPTETERSPAAEAAPHGSGPAVGTSGQPVPPPPGAREVARLATQAARDAEQRAGDAAAHPDPSQHRLEDDVAAALAFIRRSTASAPQSEGRLRAKLEERGSPRVVVDLALERARRAGLVDDEALVDALVAERRAKGHAPARIRRDLAARGFGAAELDAALAAAEAEDPEAAAFAVAKEKAARTTSLSAEAAYRRVVGHVVRRGYPEGLARKVARSAVFDSRDPERTSGH